MAERTARAVLNHLIETCTDAARGFRSAADHVTDPALKTVFTDIAMQHRIGRLAIGEASVIIAVSSPHRADAIEACHHAIDRLKSIVPVWKKEVFEGGEEWLEGTAIDAESQRAFDMKEAGR